MDVLNIAATKNVDKKFYLALGRIGAIASYDVTSRPRSSAFYQQLTIRTAAHASEFRRTSAIVCRTQSLGQRRISCSVIDVFILRA